MPSNLPDRSPPPRRPRPGEPRRTTVVYHYSASGRTGGLAGALLAVLVLLVLGGLVLLGALAITVALWIALGAVILGVLAGAVRRLFGGGHEQPPSSRGGGRR